MSRRRRHRNTAGPNGSNQPDTPREPDLLESGMSVGYDMLPPNSHLLDVNDDNPDPKLPEMAETKQAPAQQLTPQSEEQAFVNFPPPPPMKDAVLTDATEDAIVEQSEPPTGPDSDPDDQRRMTWIVNKIEIGAKLVQGRMVPDVKVRAALAVCSYKMQAGLDPTNRAKKELIIDVAYLTPEPIVLTIPLRFIPTAYRVNPAKLSTQIVEKILTAMFASFPCETVRPRPLPAALVYMPPAMREQLLRQNGLNMKG